MNPEELSQKVRSQAAARHLSVVVSGILSTLGPLFTVLAVMDMRGSPSSWSYFFLLFFFALVMMSFAAIVAQIIGITIASLLGLQRSAHPFVQANNREAFHFIRSLLLKSILGSLLIGLLSFITCSVISGTFPNTLNLFLLCVLLVITAIVLALSIAVIVLAIKAMNHAKRGEIYRYPYSIRPPSELL